MLNLLERDRRERWAALVPSAITPGRGRKSVVRLRISRVFVDFWRQVRSPRGRGDRRKRRCFFFFCAAWSQIRGAPQDFLGFCGLLAPQCDHTGAGRDRRERWAEPKNICVEKIGFGNKEKKLRWGLSTRVLNLLEPKNICVEKIGFGNKKIATLGLKHSSA